MDAGGVDACAGTFHVHGRILLRFGRPGRSAKSQLEQNEGAGRSA